MFSTEACLQEPVLLRWSRTVEPPPPSGSYCLGPVERIPMAAGQSDPRGCEIASGGRSLSCTAP
eukprot:15481180-Alexandrium_andersonii.AAC.1